MKKVLYTGLFSVLTFFLSPLSVFADDAINSGDTAWILFSTALVMFMTPGLALFYAGMARGKNVLGTIMHSFICLCLISVQWVLYGYSLAFGNDIAGLIGGFNFVGLQNVGLGTSVYSETFPHQAFMIFQGMFAVITPALITGCFVERIKFSAFVLFTFLWATFVYDPLCHWVWGGGWMSNVLGMGAALDFAGGTVVHISSGVSALVACLIIGRRRGFPGEPMPPHNLPMTMMGAAILWFGWFGFNAGSALAADGSAVNAFVVTNTSAAAAALGWLVMDIFKGGKPTALGALSGAVAGLVAITPAAGFVGAMSSIIIGFVSGILCFSAVSYLKPKLGYDDSLDVFGIHGVGGTWGALATGLFASRGGGQGLFFGNPKQLLIQFVSILATAALAIIGTIVILMIVKAVTGLRVTDQEEEEGLDVAVHGEKGYNF